jgi:hypothetical protein
LTLSEEKTRKILFSRFEKKESESFTFLGFTFYWGTSHKGNDVVMVHTSRKKIHQTLQNLKQWVKENRRNAKRWIMEQVMMKLRGHKNYFGIQGNSLFIRKVVDESMNILYKWLNRRSQRRSYNWESFERMLKHFNFRSLIGIRNNGVQISCLSQMC